MSFETTICTPTPKIDIAEIPRSQMRSLCSVTLDFVESFYRDEKNLSGRDAWLKRQERAAQRKAGAAV
ncbi:MAG: hypothetical protein RR235_08220 [Oscillospiraceae bacterium]